MSKVVKHTNQKIADIKLGHTVRTKHKHFTQGKSGYVPNPDSNTMTANDIKKSKR